MGREIESKLFSSHFQKRENSETKERPEVEEGKLGTGAQGCEPQVSHKPVEIGLSLTTQACLSMSPHTVNTLACTASRLPHTAGPSALRLTPSYQLIIVVLTVLCSVSLSQPPVCALSPSVRPTRESTDGGVSFPASTLLTLLLLSQCLFCCLPYPQAAGEFG